MARLATFVAVLALALAGCGGDGPSDGGAPEKRPDDFAATFKHADGSTPPQFHVEWTLSVRPGGSGELEFVPGYSSPKVPRFRESFSVDAAALDRLYAKMRSAGLLESRDAGDADVAPAGGESNGATITFSGRKVEIPPYDSDGSEVLGPVEEDIEQLVPQAVWDRMERRHDAYVKRQGY